MAHRCGNCPSRRKEKIEDGAHARLSPSSSSRWLHCPGSIQLIEQMGYADEGNEAADTGTILHSFMEDCLRDNIEAYEFIGHTRSHGEVTLTLDEDMADVLQSGLDEIDLLPGKIYVEYQVDLGRWMPGQFGTLDVGLVGKKTIHIWDHKFGRIPVSPVDNSQMMIYALGFWENVARHITDAQKFVLHVFQPFASRGGGQWTVYLDELLEFGKEVKRKARRTYDKDAERIPGPKQCLYCPAAENRDCAEYDAYNYNSILEDFGDLDDTQGMGVAPRVTRPEKLTFARMAYLVDHRSMIEKWLDRVEAQLIHELVSGKDVPGYKAVNGNKKPRKWVMPEIAQSLLKRKLGDEAFTRKLITPTMAEKLLPPKQFAKVEDYIRRDPPNVTLARDHDDRPAIKSIVDEFEDLD
jgi:hypothetical protein